KPDVADQRPRELQNGELLGAESVQEHGHGDDADDDRPNLAQHVERGVAGEEPSGRHDMEAKGTIGPRAFMNDPARARNTPRPRCAGRRPDSDGARNPPTASRWPPSAPRW